MKMLKFLLEMLFVNIFRIKSVRKLLVKVGLEWDGRMATKTYSHLVYKRR